MTKKIQAYFQNENDALGAKTKLERYEVGHLEIGSLSEHDRPGVPVAIPFGVGNISTMGVGSTGSGITSGGVPIPLIFKRMGEHEERFDSVVALEVKDETLTKVEEVLREHNGRWEVF